MGPTLSAKMPCARRGARWPIANGQLQRPIATASRNGQSQWPVAMASRNGQSRGQSQRPGEPQRRMRSQPREPRPEMCYACNGGESSGKPARSFDMAPEKKKSQEARLNTYRAGPNEQGFFGLFGGRFVAETLMPLILELGRAYEEAKADPTFQSALEALHAHYAGRPSPLYFAERLTRHLGGAKIGRASC